MTQSINRILILVAGSVIWLGSVVKHSEPDTNVGLRYIHEAEAIDRGHWIDALVGGIDHPVHPLAIAGTHRILGGHGPASWQRAALVLCFASVVLLVVPVYLLALELFGHRTAWLAGLLVIVNPTLGSVVVNVLSESTFLLFWTFGLWGAVRFLREGRFVWLPLAIGFGAVAYLTRPEGMLLPAALSGVLLALPLVRATRINWPRWWAAMAFIVAGLLFLVGPYIAIKGGVGTKPAIARVLGLAPPPEPMALEREVPLAPGQSEIQTYRIASIRALEAIESAITLSLIPLALMGMVRISMQPGRERVWLFLGLVLIASALTLVRLHATTGYCSPRHALLPGLLLSLAAAHALTWLMDRMSIPGRWIGSVHARLYPGPAIWGLVVACIFLVPGVRALGPACPGPYWVYIATGDWLALNSHGAERVLDLTDWSLYFSERPGYNLASLSEAIDDPNTRWLVVRRPAIAGNTRHDQMIRELTYGLHAVAELPAGGKVDRGMVRIYDLRSAPVPAFVHTGHHEHVARTEKTGPQR